MFGEYEPSCLSKIDRSGWWRPCLRNGEKSGTWQPEVNMKENGKSEAKIRSRHTV